MPLPLPQPPSPAEPDRAARDRIELDWFVRMRADDEAAFEALFRAYVEPLCAFAYSYVESQASAQEIVQDLFARVWERRRALEVPRSVHAYLYGAVRNGAINALRNRRVQRAFLDRAQRDEAARPLAPRREAADEGLEAEALGALVADALREMPPRCREVYALVREQHLSYADTAVALDISPKTVEIHMGRALAFLRRKLGPWLSGD